MKTDKTNDDDNFYASLDKTLDELEVTEDISENKKAIDDLTFSDSIDVTRTQKSIPIEFSLEKDFDKSTERLNDLLDKIENPRNQKEKDYYSLGVGLLNSADKVCNFQINHRKIIKLIDSMNYLSNEIENYLKNLQNDKQDTDDNANDKEYNNENEKEEQKKSKKKLIAILSSGGAVALVILITLLIKSCNKDNNVSRNNDVAKNILEILDENYSTDEAIIDTTTSPITTITTTMATTQKKITTTNAEQKTNTNTTMSPKITTTTSSTHNSVETQKPITTNTTTRIATQQKSNGIDIFTRANLSPESLNYRANEVLQMVNNAVNNYNLSVTENKLDKFTKEDITKILCVINAIPYNNRTLSFDEVLNVYDKMKMVLYADSLYSINAYNGFLKPKENGLNLDLNKFVFDDNVKTKEVITKLQASRNGMINNQNNRNNASKYAQDFINLYGYYHLQYNGGNINTDNLETSGQELFVDAIFYNEFELATLIDAGSQKINFKTADKTYTIETLVNGFNSTACGQDFPNKQSQDLYGAFIEQQVNNKTLKLNN